MSYARSESIAADGSKLAGERQQVQWPENGGVCQGWLRWQQRQPRGEDGSQPRQPGAALQIFKKSDLSWHPEARHFHSELLSPGENPIGIPFSLPEITKHLPLDTGWWPPAWLLLIDSLSLPHSGRSKLAAPEETLTRAALVPGSSPDPLVFEIIITFFWILSASNPERKA